MSPSRCTTSLCAKLSLHKLSSSRATLEPMNTCGMSRLEAYQLVKRNNVVCDNEQLVSSEYSPLKRFLYRRTSNTRHPLKLTNIGESNKASLLTLLLKHPFFSRYSAAEGNICRKAFHGMAWICTACGKEVEIESKTRFIRPYEQHTGRTISSVVGEDRERYLRHYTRLGRKMTKHVPECMFFVIIIHMYVCMYVWSSHIAEYGSTG